MDTLQLTLPTKLRAFIDAEAAARGHTSAHDYLVAVLKEAQRKRAWEIAEKLVLEGMQTPARPLTEDDWAQLHARIHQMASADDGKS